MPVHVSIHDVSPRWAEEVDLALEMAHTVGVKPALLVVPDFHGKAPLLASPSYCARLRALQADGHEIYLHGFFHKSREHGDEAEGEGRPRGLSWLFAQKVVSGGEAEFSDVTKEEAVDRLNKGELTLREAGLTIDGFVAPAWSMPAWLLPMLRERKYAFTEDHTHVYSPKGGTSKASLVLNFASRSPARLLSTVAYCRAARPARRLLPTRVAIHPGDMKVALLRNEVADLLAWGRGDYVARGTDLLA